MTMEVKPKKTLKVAICTPTAGIIHAAYCMSFTRMILYFLQTPVLGEEYSDKRVISQMQVGANIGENRDKMVDRAIEQECTHLLFIDDDMGFMPDCLNIAISRQMPIVLANYRRKSCPGYFTATTAAGDISGAQMITTEDSTSLEQAYFGGFGFCLMEVETLKKIQKPRFLMQYFPEIDTYTTEDWPFFEKVRALGIPIFVDHEVSKRVWHCGTFNYCFDQNLPPEWSTPWAERKLKNA